MRDSPEYDLERVVSALLAARGYADDDRARQYLDIAIDSVLPGGSGEETARAPRAVGESVSDFTLPGADADGISTYQLSDYTESGAVILAFYPFDFSPVCTTQLCAFRDAEFLELTPDVDVFGISVDSAHSHRRFREEYDLQFPLLSDRLATVAADFGVKYDLWEDHPAVSQRAMFAIDDTRTIRYAWHAENARGDPTPDDLGESIAWLPGGETGA